MAKIVKHRNKGNWYAIGEGGTQLMQLASFKTDYWDDAGAFIVQPARGYVHGKITKEDMQQRKKAWLVGKTKEHAPKDTSKPKAASKPKADAKAKCKPKAKGKAKAKSRAACADDDDENRGREGWRWARLGPQVGEAEAQEQRGGGLGGRGQPERLGGRR